MELVKHLKTYKPSRKHMWGGTYYSIDPAAPGDYKSSVRGHGCYGPVGGYVNAVSEKHKRPFKMWGFVVHNHSQELQVASDPAEVLYARTKTRPNAHVGSDLLIDLLLAPDYKGRFKIYIDEACKELGLSLDDYREFVREYGLVIPTTLFTTRPKLEVMSLMMFFRETFNINPRTILMNKLFKFKTYYEWHAALLYTYNCSNYNRPKEIIKGHGTNHPRHQLADVKNFLEGTDEIAYPKSKYTAPFGENHYWSNSGCVVYDYIGNNNRTRNMGKWEQLIAPAMRPFAPDMEYGTTMQAWTFLWADASEASKLVQDTQAAFYEAIKGVIKTCVASLESQET